ncbi:MAG TPA: VCBS repeat-containing protein [Streptomyces sp.]|nr:VCBS repeat-containing protein [Streptomyces sp.]
MFGGRVFVAAVAVSVSAIALVPVTGSAATAPVRAATSMVAQDVAVAAGLRVAHTRTWSALAGDYNRDGAQDVLINYHGHFGGIHKATSHAAKLWRNKGRGRYTQDLALPFYSGDRHGKLIDRHNCDWADVDRNGHTDLYCAAGRTESNVIKRGRDNELWLQDGRGRFREVGTVWGVGDVCGRGRDVAFVHANGDQYPDLFVGNDLPRRIASDPCNTSTTLPDEESKLFLNVRGERFRPAPGYWDYGGSQGDRCAEVLDFNNDGWDDLFTCPRAGMTPRLYQNQAGAGFADVTPASMLAQTVNDAVIADLDSDGDPDVVTASDNHFGYYLNDNGQYGGEGFIAPVAAPRRGWSVATGDTDGDGDVDVYGMVEKGLYANPDDSIWLNDGLTFTRVPVPHAGGAADDVTALRPGRTGRTSFLVQNGRKRFRSGPVQLIRVVRR